jgi:hypothetical protein
MQAVATAVAASQAQGQGMSHETQTRDMPIIVICNQPGGGNDSCVRRETPNNEVQDMLR